MSEGKCTCFGKNVPEGHFKPAGGTNHRLAWKHRCQCVMCHNCMTEGTLGQCGQFRNKDSNLFCAGCEELHGDYYRAKHGGSK